MVEKVPTRSILATARLELWGRAAGRCEFPACNRPLYKSPVTQERVNIAEQAHIFSFSKHGPRGWGPYFVNRKKLNDVSNLLRLLTRICGRSVDRVARQACGRERLRRL
jgi:hypothetical protein